MNHKPSMAFPTTLKMPGAAILSGNRIRERRAEDETTKNTNHTEGGRRVAVFTELRRAESVFAELTFQSLPGPSTTYQDLPWASRKPGRRGPGTEDNAKGILLLLAAHRRP